MELKSAFVFYRNEKRCEIRPLLVSDITTGYIDSLRSNSRVLKNVSREISYSSQTDYIVEIQRTPGYAIFGFFLDGALAGTCGVQAILKDDLMSVGVLMLDATEKMKGWGQTTVWGTCMLLIEDNARLRIVANVHQDNLASLKLFESIGFRHLVQSGILVWAGCAGESLKSPTGISGQEYL
jgi:hypothetical protein